LPNNKRQQASRGRRRLFASFEKLFTSSVRDGGINRIQKQTNTAEIIGKLRITPISTWNSIIIPQNHRSAFRELEKLKPVVKRIKGTLTSRKIAITAAAVRRPGISNK
jgi:hypothetical protein